MANAEFDNKHKCYIVDSAGSQSSGGLATMNNADCFLLFPEELTELKKGDWVECIKI